MQKRLGCKISLFILVPLIFGTAMTGLVSWLPVYLQYSTWIDDIVDSMINDQGHLMQEIGFHLATRGAAFLQVPTNGVMIMGKLMDMYYQGDLQVKANFRDDGNYLSAFDLAEANSTQTNYNYSMWYLNPSITNPIQLPKRSRDNLHTSAIFDSFSRPILNVESNSRLVKMYHAFDNDGLFYVFPATGYPSLLNYTDNPDCVYDQNRSPQYDPRCRPWYEQTASASNHFLAVLSHPFRIANNKMIGQNACRSVWSSGELTVITSVEFTISELEEVLDKLSIGDESYAFALDANGTVYSHPGLDRSQKSVPSILELEFNSTDSPEAKAFATQILPHFLQGNSVLTQYLKNGKWTLLATSPIYIDLTVNGVYVHMLTVGLVLPEEDLHDMFSPLRTDCNQVMIVEMVVFFSILAGILVFAWM